MWWKFCQSIENTARNKICHCILDWLKATPPYSSVDATDYPQYFDWDYYRISEEINDNATNDLLNYYEKLKDTRNPQVWKDFVINFANHPALKPLAEKNKSSQSDTLNTPEKIKKTIADWYKVEYRLMLSKQNNLSNTVDIENQFRILSRRLGDMLILAANNWLKWHKSMVREALQHKGQEEKNPMWNFLTDWDKKLLEIEPNMRWVVGKMSAPNPTQGDISIAIQICHAGGSILEYIPYHDKQNYKHYSREDLWDMKDFLSDLSDAETMPEAEKEANHDISNLLYPKEEHSPEWRQAKKKKGI
jgi:hypothetical protein